MTPAMAPSMGVPRETQHHGTDLPSDLKTWNVSHRRQTWGGGLGIIVISAMLGMGPKASHKLGVLVIPPLKQNTDTTLQEGGLLTHTPDMVHCG